MSSVELRWASAPEYRPARKLLLELRKSILGNYREKPRSKRSPDTAPPIIFHEQFRARVRSSIIWPKSTRCGTAIVSPVSGYAWDDGSSDSRALHPPFFFVERCPPPQPAGQIHPHNFHSGLGRRNCCGPATPSPNPASLPSRILDHGNLAEAAPDFGRGTPAADISMNFISDIAPGVW